MRGESRLLALSGWMTTAGIQRHLLVRQMLSVSFRGLTFSKTVVVNLKMLYLQLAHGKLA